VWEMSGYSDKAKDAVIRRQPMSSIGRLAASRAYGKLDYEVFKTVILSNADVGRIMQWIAFAIVCVPGGVFRLSYVFYIKLFRRSQSKRFSPALALVQLEP